MGLMGCVFAVCAIMVFYVSTTEILLIKSPYAGYELGYEPTILRPSKFCSTQMKSTDNVKLNGDLYDKEIYNIDNEKKVTTIASKKNVLCIGKYSVDVSLGNDSKKVMVSVFDTIKPFFTRTYDCLKMTSFDELSNYIEVEDFSEVIDITYYADKQGIIYITATDEGRNSQEASFKYELVEKAEQATKKPFMTDQATTYRFKRAESLDKYNEIVNNYAKEQEQIVKKEDNLRKQLLTDEEYRKVKKDLDRKHEELEKKNDKKTEIIEPEKPKKEDNTGNKTDKDDKDESGNESDTKQPTACTDKPPRGYFFHESTARGSTPKGYVFKGWTGSPIEVCRRTYRKANYQKKEVACEPKLEKGQYATEQDAKNALVYGYDYYIKPINVGNCGQQVWVIEKDNPRTEPISEEIDAWNGLVPKVKGNKKFVYVKITEKQRKETGLSIDYRNNLSRYVSKHTEYGTFSRVSIDTDPDYLVAIFT